MISLQPGRFHFGTRKSNVLAGNAPEPLATRTIDHLWHRYVEAPCVALVYDTSDPDLVLGVDHLRPHPLNMIVGFFHFCTLCTLELLPPSYHFGLGVFGHQRSDPSCAIGFLHVPT
jgi:hypothetical protein